MNTSFFGRLTKDPDARYNDNGTPYTFFTVAVNLPVKSQDGNYKAIFIDVTAFGKAAENIVKFFFKGSRIVVDGIIRDISIGQSNKGNSYLNISVTLTDFSFVDTKNEKNNSNNKNSQPPRDYQNQNYSAPPTPPNNSYTNSPSPWR